ncbi:MAG: hypothetical protein ACJ8F7_02235 [Gemmataceae bacterium]
MKRVRDAWYIRLPGGQELKAKTTKAVIHHVDTGIIPRASLVRRATDQEWKPLDWTREFAEVLKGGDAAESTASQPDTPALPGIASRLDPMRLRTVGVRGIWEDLLAALDNTFVRPKLVAVAATAAVVGLLLVLATWTAAKLSLGWSPRLVQEAAGFVGVLALGVLNGLLARMTHIELSNMRRCRPGEATRGFFPVGFRLVLAYFLVVGSCALVAALMRSLPAAFAVTLTDYGAPAWVGNLGHSAVAVLGTIIEAALWLAVGLTGLLAPVMVVEECDVFTALGSWCRLLRDHPGRVLLAEALAISLGLLVTLPFAAPAYLALAGREFTPAVVGEAIRGIAWGLALTPLLAFLAVANLFIYLDVRYEQNG